MRVLAVFCFALFAVCGFATAAEPPPPLADMGPVFEAGLKLTIESGGKADSRIARLMTLRVPAGTLASPLLPAGAFRATWEGMLNLRIKDQCTFSAHGNGSLKLSINDEVVFDASGDDLSKTPGKPVKLKKGRNSIRAEYASPQSGDAWIRVYWSARDFLPEAVPPMVFTHDASDKPLRERLRVREGRSLFAELRCIRCHASGASSPGDGAMPELSQDGPDLSNAGARLNEAWMAAWIANPKSLNPRAEMPRVFKGEGVAQEAADVAAYLATLGGTAGSGEAASEQAQRDAGARLYTGLGCIACHTPPGAAPGADMVNPPRIPHRYVALKYTPAALGEFLKAPEAHFKWIRMPNFRLTDREIAALSAFLLHGGAAASDLPKAPPGDAARGKTLFESSGCLACHTAGTAKNSAAALSLEKVAKSVGMRGCLAPDDAARGRAPDFSFTPQQRAALAAFSGAGVDSLRQDPQPEFAERQIAVLNCTACHARDKQDDAWSGLRGEIDAIVSALPAESPPGAGEEKFSGDQTRPDLTWVGEKLRPQWMGRFIGGKIPYKPREWLMARMPGFPARAVGVAEGLALEHGCATSLPPPPAPDPTLAAIGQKLVGKDGGFSCVQCHSVGSVRALAPFEAPAINFAHVSERLTREFYDRWVWNPQRVMPGTRMPRFGDADGKTSLKQYFDGNAAKQFDAIWNYLLAGDKIVAPGQ
jgi:mono/diheme cytochrome c family protein